MSQDERAENSLAFARVSPSTPFNPLFLHL